MIDTNNDTRLSSVELQNAEAQSVISRYAGATGGFVDLASVDTDGDNFVSFSELADVYPGLSANDWRAIDLRGDNRLTSAELSAVETQVVLDRSTGSTSDFVALDAIDLDGSRFASFGELSGAFPGLTAIDFSDIDRNNDNRISFNELNDIDSRTILGRAQR